MYITDFKIHDRSTLASNAPTLFYLGTAVKLTVILNIDTADIAIVRVVDSCLSKKVDDVTMTKTADGVYTYNFQSEDSGWQEGDYIITIKIEKDGVRDVIQRKIQMVDPEPEGDAS